GLALEQMAPVRKVGERVAWILYPVAELRAKRCAEDCRDADPQAAIAVFQHRQREPAALPQEQAHADRIGRNFETGVHGDGLHALGAFGTGRKVLKAATTGAPLPLWER